LSNAESQELIALEGWWRITPAAGEKLARAQLYRLGPRHFSDQVLLAWSRSAAGVADPAWQALARLPEIWTVPAFPLKAADFIRRGIAAGPTLGAALRAAEEAWIVANFPGDRTAVESIADWVAREIASAG